MLLRDNWIEQCCHGLCYHNYFQINANSINSVPNSNSEIERTVIKEETDPLLITFQDMQGKNEVCIYVHLSTLLRDMHECMLSPACLHAAGSKEICLFGVLIKHYHTVLNCQPYYFLVSNFAVEALNRKAEVHLCTCTRFD
jgi:hypothetical protein